MPRPGMPHPTKATGVVEAARVASHRGAPRCSVRSASILALLFLRCYRCKWCTTVQPNPIESGSRAGCKDESTGLAFFRHWTNRDRKTLILYRRTASGALPVVLAPFGVLTDADEPPSYPNKHNFRTVTPTPPPRRAPAVPAAPRPRAPRSRPSARGPPEQTKARRRRE